MFKNPSIKNPLPGDLAMWVFILAELSVFAILFITYAVNRQMHPELFAQGQALLHPIAGTVITLALLTASYFVALAVALFKQHQHQKAAWNLYAALACGVLYLVVKSWEYQLLFEAGYGLSTNTFFSFYFMLTMFHMAHVILGMGILWYLAIRLNRGAYADGNDNPLESGGSYWHMVDLVWLLLFPLVYLVH